MKVTTLTSNNQHRSGCVNLHGWSWKEHSCSGCFDHLLLELSRHVETAYFNKTLEEFPGVGTIENSATWRGQSLHGRNPHDIIATLAFQLEFFHNLLSILRNQFLCYLCCSRKVLLIVQIPEILSDSLERISYVVVTAHCRRCDNVSILADGSSSLVISSQILASKKLEFFASPGETLGIIDSELCRPIIAENLGSCVCIIIRHNRTVSSHNHNETATCNVKKKSDNLWSPTCCIVGRHHLVRSH
mmetsp:Transcript_14641/g.22302  ORF Transcript_14641/g.22302 Transcript_14641/m.22302 type:complete len:245 (+) Transcript_14641:950-1684(+)